MGRNNVYEVFSTADFKQVINLYQTGTVLIKYIQASGLYLFLVRKEGTKITKPVTEVNIDYSLEISSRLLTGVEDSTNVSVVFICGGARDYLVVELPGTADFAALWGTAQGMFRTTENGRELCNPFGVVMLPCEYEAGPALQVSTCGTGPAHVSNSIRLPTREEITVRSVEITTFLFFFLNCFNQSVTW